MVTFSGLTESGTGDRDKRGGGGGGGGGASTSTIWENLI